ncbi:serine protease gd-like [Hyposmocoma kahamanoa]|uniref:serine protease gd-like n=1 Tax=Hyposmocoma kahamanoa TaxID=1477025 RepID=UPI000E6D95D9|nr:serine protease gd-like [Hyposmocoma kahamanoa]
MYGAFIFLVLPILIKAHHLTSPCPSIFEYKRDNSGLHGKIHLRNSGIVSNVLIRANFTIATRLSNTYVGRLAPTGDNPYILDDFNHGMPIDYRVDFPTTSPLPKLTALIVNDNVICTGPGDIPTSTEYVTTISLQHTLFHKGQEGSNFHVDNSLNNKYEQPQTSKPQLNFDLSEFFNLDGNNGQTQIYTFGGDGNPQGWNTINYTNEQHATQPPQHVPVIQYNPEVTQAPRPATQPPTSPQRPSLTFPSTEPATDHGSSVECGIVSGGNEQQPLISNGAAYNRGEWPWLVAIYRRRELSLSFICGGTLISERHIVTAAHCMRVRSTKISKRDLVIKVGVHNLEDWSDDITVTRSVTDAYIHESYDAKSLANDILLLKLDRTVKYNNNIRPICLWSGNADLSRVVGKTGVVTGWGETEDGPAGHGEPKMARLPIVSTTVCRGSRPEFHTLTSSTTLCAGDRSGTGPCSGDSGGGLYLSEGGRWRLRGIVSTGLNVNGNTCNFKDYIVFTDSAQYTSWIRTVMSY